MHTSSIEKTLKVFNEIVFARVIQGIKPNGKKLFFHIFWCMVQGILSRQGKCFFSLKNTLPLFDLVKIAKDKRSLTFREYHYNNDDKILIDFSRKDSTVIECIYISAHNEKDE